MCLFIRSVCFIFFRLNLFQYNVSLPSHAHDYAREHTQQIKFAGSRGGKKKKKKKGHVFTYSIASSCSAPLDLILYTLTLRKEITLCLQSFNITVSTYFSDLLDLTFLSTHMHKSASLSQCIAFTTPAVHQHALPISVFRSM